MELTREELISICYDSVVPFQDWQNRDSFIAQSQLEEAYQMLKSGFEYTYSVEGDTIWLNFKALTQEEKDKYIYCSLDIGTREEYLEEFGFDSELFEYNGKDISQDVNFYIPTRQRLEKYIGQDWY